MKSSTLKIIFIQLILLLLTLSNSFVFDIFSIKEYTYSFVLILGFIIMILMFGLAKSTHTNRKDIMWVTILYTIAYQMILFVLFGWKLGFLKSPYKYGLNHLFKIVLPMVLIIVMSELLRYQMISKGKKSKAVMISTIIFFVLIDIAINSYLYEFNTISGIFQLILFGIGPSLMRNVLFTFYIYYFGYKPSIACRIFMEMPLYVLPIYPDLGEFITTIATIIYPTILIFAFWKSARHKEKQNKIETDQVKIIKKFAKVCWNLFIYWILLSIVCLMSGHFKYAFLAVGSGSMEPTLKYGDAVIYKKVDDFENIKMHDILVYKHDKKMIIHRIVNIKYENGKYIFKTKGDNNKSQDSWEVTEKNVAGIVKLRGKYLGYPTIFVKDKIIKGE